MNKKYVICIIVLVYTLMSGCSKSEPSIHKIENEVTISTFVDRFDLDDYEEYMNQVPTQNGYIPNAETATKIAEILLIEIYGYEEISEKKPLTVKYDQMNKVWLVQGTLKEGEDGGIPYVLLNQEDGKVLSIWHDK